MPIYSNRPRGPAGGDLSGSYPDPQVVNLSGSATGSFSGSFAGDGSSLINLSAPTIPVVSSSHILYVSADSTDTGADGSFNKPFATISASLAHAKTRYASTEHVEIFLNPGSYPAFTLDRHNTYIKSDLSHERQRGATISGPIVINCTGSTQKYNQIVGFDGLFITGPSNSTSSTVYLTGSGAHLAYFKDCFLYSNTNVSHIFKCDADFDTHKIIFKDSIFLAEKSGSSFLQLNGGDFEINGSRIQTNATGSGTCISGSGDLYIAADRLYVETYANGNIFDITSLKTPALVVGNSTLSTYGTGKPVNAPGNVVFVGNTFFGGALANNFNINAFAVSYSNLTSTTASNAVTVSASLSLPAWETHGNIIANSVTGSLYGTASYAIAALTASYVNPLTQSVYIQGDLSASLGITGSFSGNGAGLINVPGTLSGGAASYIPKWNSATSLTSSVIYEIAGGKIGIGTTSPDDKLTVIGTTNSSQFQAGELFISGTNGTSGSIVHISKGGDGSSYLSIQSVANSNNKKARIILSSSNTNGNSGSVELYTNSVIYPNSISISMTANQILNVINDAPVLKVTATSGPWTGLLSTTGVATGTRITILNAGSNSFYIDPGFGCPPSQIHEGLARDYIYIPGNDKGWYTIQ